MGPPFLHLNVAALLEQRFVTIAHGFLKNLIAVRLDQIVESPDPESLYRVKLAGGRKNEQTIAVCLTDFFCRFNAIQTIHVNIQKNKIKGVRGKALKKMAAAFKERNLRIKLVIGAVTVDVLGEQFTFCS